MMAEFQGVNYTAKTEGPTTKSAASGLTVGEITGIVAATVTVLTLCLEVCKWFPQTLPKSVGFAQNIILMFSSQL